MRVLPALLLGLIEVAAADEPAWPDPRSRWALTQDFDLRILVEGLEGAIALDPGPPLRLFGDSGLARVLSSAGLSEASKAGEPPPRTLQLEVARGAAGFPASSWGSRLLTDGRLVEVVSRSGSSAPFLAPRGPGQPSILSLALGERGLLLLVDDPERGGAVLEVRHRPAYEYPWRIGHEPRVRDRDEAAGHAVMAAAGCFACHSLHGRRQVGPSLDRESLVPRLEQRLASAEYLQRLAALDARPEEAMRRWRRARAEVRATEGVERLRSWLRWHLIEPRFDEPDARMPSMGLTEEQIETVSRFLLGPARPAGEPVDGGTTRGDRGIEDPAALARSGPRGMMRPSRPRRPQR